MKINEELYYCERDYSRVSYLPNVKEEADGKLNYHGFQAYHITASGGNDFKRLGDQSDATYRRLFNDVGRFCKSKISDLDINNYGGFHYVLCGGTSFIHGSATAGGYYEEELGKPHLHMILYTNCWMLAGEKVKNSKGYDVCKGGLIEGMLKEKGIISGVNVSPFSTAETIDYVLQQRIEPEPLFESDLENMHEKSLLKTIVKQYPLGKNYKNNLRKWDRNIGEATKKILGFEGLGFNEVLWLDAPLSHPTKKLKILGRGGVLECNLLQKAFTLAHTKQRKKKAKAQEIQGVADGFWDREKDAPLIAHYLFRVYWNSRLIHKVNLLAGQTVLEPLTTYTRTTNGGKVECWTRCKIDFRTGEGKRLKEEGWK